MSNLPIPVINVVDLNRLLNEKAKLCLIDVREDYEWETGHIPTAIHLPKNTLAINIAMHVTNLEQPIYLYCKAGVRSAYAAQILLEMGYKQVYSVDGGVIAWQAHNYSLTT